MILSGVVALLLASPLAAQSPTVGMAGEVTCRQGIPVALATMSRFTGLARDENRIHEAVHLKQFRDDCEATRLRWQMDPLFRLNLEVEAYCVGVEVYADTAYRTRRRGDELRMLSYLWGSEVGFEDIYAALDEWCPR